MMKRLPDAEFEIMKTVWNTAAPMSVSAVAKQMDKEWKIQTLISLMNRLVDRGFIRTEKIDKERVYYPIITREDYLKFETGNFVKQYHESSFLSLVNTLYDNKDLTSEDIDGLIRWIQERRDG